MLVPLLDCCCYGCVAAFATVEFLFCAPWVELRIFVNKNCKKASTVYCFFLTKQKGSVALILLALQNNSTGSVLANDGTLDVGIRELKPGVAAPVRSPLISMLSILCK